MTALPVVEVDLGPRVRAGFTTRLGGVSTGPWAALNLGLHVDDDPAAVRVNRRRLEEWVGCPVRFGRQVHGVTVLPVAAVEVPGGGPPAHPGPECDGLLATTADRAPGVLVADCVPVLLADDEAGVVAAVHAGRRGLVAGVLQAAVDAMTDAGAVPARIRAALGPAAGPCCYEVPEQLCADVESAVPGTRARTTWGTPSVDLRAGCRAVLAAAGVADVAVVGGCTMEDDALFSYRRTPQTGRFAGVVRMVA